MEVAAAAANIRLPRPYTGGMGAPFTPDQEAQFAQIANHPGTDPEHLVEDAALRLLEQDTSFAPE